MGLVRRALEAASSLEFLGTPWARDTFSNTRQEAAANAINDFLTGNPDIPTTTRVKLMFYRSDLLRFSNIVRRISQGVVDSTNPDGPIELEHVVLGMWRLRRQWQLHSGMQNRCVDVAKTLPRSIAMAGQLSTTPSAARALTNDQVLAAAILNDTQVEA